MRPSSGSRRIDVLLLEDNPGDARIVQELSKASPAVNIIQLDRLAAGIEYLVEHEVDVILLDLGLPDSQGIETLRAVLEARRAIPVVILTGIDDEALCEEALRMGAQEYLVKGRVAENALIRAIRYAIDRNESRIKLDRLIGFQHILRDFDQLIVREKDPLALIQQTCAMLVEERGYSGSWIALDHPPGLQPIASHAGSIVDGFEAFAAMIKSGVHPPCWNTARTSNEGFALLEEKESCLGCPLRGKAGGVRAVVVIGKSETDFGTLCVRAAPGALIEDDEKTFIMELRDDLGIALHGIQIERRNLAFAQIVENSQDAMAIVGSEYVFEEVNPSYERFFGLESGNVHGRHMSDVFGAERFMKVIKPLLDRCLKGEVVVFESSGEASGPGPEFTEARYSPCLVANGCAYSVAVNIRDVTERRLSEQRINGQLEELQRWQGVMLGREERIADLKREVNGLCLRLRDDARYPSQKENA